MSAQELAPVEGQGSRRDYVVGFFLSVVLTAVPFWLVMGHVIESKQAVAFLIVVFAAAQMIAHVTFFLHVSAKSQGGWTLVSLIFALILVVITLAGSVWVMYHLDSNMMPRQDVSQLP